MAWTKSTTTQHTCGGPVFGRTTPGCPRCDELISGAAPVVWAGTEKFRCMTCGQVTDRAGVCFSCSLKHHLATHTCTVCTFGDW